MIKPSKYKELCNHIFGKCTFDERPANPLLTGERLLTEDYYIDCLVNDVKVATLHVSKDLSSYASIYTNDNGTGVIFASYGFTLKRALKKAKRNIDSERDRLFAMYSKITHKIGSSRKDITTMIQYLTNVEFGTDSYLFTNLMKNVFESACHSNPELYDSSAKILTEYFSSKVVR